MINCLKYWAIIFFSFLIVSCKTSQKSVVPRNLERIYDPASSSLHPEIKVYNTSDTSSLVIDRIYTKELLYNKANTESRLLARIKVINNLYDLNNKNKLVDSSTTTFKFDKNADVLYHNLEIEVSSLKGGNYLLEIITTDLNRKSNQYSFCRIDRTKELNPQDFLIYNKPSKEFKVNSLIKSNNQFEIKHYKKDIDSLRVFFFTNTFNIPQPPYFVDTIKENLEIADTTWICFLDSIKYSNFQNEGVYFFTEAFQTLNSNEGGFSLFNFGNGFPIVRSPKELIRPLNYLGFNDSITSDSTGKLTKLAVDSFWLRKANNIDKSRELLKLYYNRVMFANMYFTSYKEGWQTDRGMIYIIYGLPDYLFKSGEEERWIYNPEGVGAGIAFIFNYVKDPMSLNHYILDREKLKATGWDEVIKLWNSGEIFYFQN